MADKFEKMLEMQRHLQMNSFGADPINLAVYGNDAERSEFAYRSIIMMLDEAHEALGEISWKWWTSEKFFNEEEFKGEVVDIMHFVLNLVMVSGMSPEEFYIRYQWKNTKNAERQRAGYGGKTDKCSVCHAHTSEGCVHMGEPIVEEL
jgi:dimeric dUTPase (all-alpha-NTP-PPase superfamily)